MLFTLWSTMSTARPSSRISVISLAKDAETGQRGFLLTGEPSYLEPYNKAVSQVDIHIQNLSGLTVDNPRQQANVAHLGSLAHMKLNELEDQLTELAGQAQLRFDTLGRMATSDGDGA